MTGMPKKVYLVQMNLSGLHHQVYEMFYNKELGEYFDKSGDLSCTTRWVRDPHIQQLVFKKRAHAEIAMLGAKMVANMLIERLKK